MPKSFVDIDEVYSSPPKQATYGRKHASISIEEPWWPQTHTKIHESQRFLGLLSKISLRPPYVGEGGGHASESPRTQQFDNLYQT